MLKEPNYSLAKEVMIGGLIILLQGLLFAMTTGSPFFLFEVACGLLVYWAAIWSIVAETNRYYIMAEIEWRRALDRAKRQHGGEIHTTEVRRRHEK